MTDPTLRRVLESARDKIPAYQFCTSPEDGVALTKALAEKLIAPDTTTFVLTKLGEKALKKKPALPLLTHSEIQTFQRCPREHHFSYRLLRRPKRVSHALMFGSAFDKLLQEWWKAGPLHGRNVVMETLEALEIDPFDKAKLRALLLGYDARWANEPLEVLKVQPVFRLPIFNPETNRKSKDFDLGGRLDVLVKDIRTGEIIILETKTTSLDIASESSYWHTIAAIDPQISTYYKGARALGYEAQRCTYDVIRKPQLVPLKATPEDKRQYKKGTTILYANQRAEDETPDEYFERIALDILESPEKYFAREPIVRLEQDEAAHSADLWMTAKQIKENEIKKRAPKHPGACRRFGSFCPFMPVCSGLLSIESYDVVEERHGELT